MRAVHGIACLECDDLPPCELLEVRTELRGCVCRLCEYTQLAQTRLSLTSEVNIVEMGRRLNGRNLAPNVELLHSRTQICHRWVSGVVRAENFDSLFHMIGLVNVINCKRVRWRIRV